MRKYISAVAAAISMKMPRLSVLTVRFFQ